MLFIFHQIRNRAEKSFSCIGRTRYDRIQADLKVDKKKVETRHRWRSWLICKQKCDFEIFKLGMYIEFYICLLPAKGGPTNEPRPSKMSKKP